MSRMFALLLLCGLSSLARADCNDLYRQARATQDGARLEQLARRAARAPDCDRGFVRALRGRAAARLYNEVARALARGAAPETHENQLKRSLRLRRLWQALDLLGDIARDRRDYAEATRRYQEALEVIDDPAATPRPPRREMIGAIYAKAERARLLAKGYQPVPRSRSTRLPSGLGASSIRGFVPHRVALPITFDFDSTRFTDQGRLAADDLYDYLHVQGSPDIRLIGHTDPIGDAQYNLALSQRRAEAVRDYLIKLGYSGEIATEGRGESEPFAVDDPSRYTREERYRMDRRVELHR